MAYNNKNYWLRIIDIQELVLNLQEEHLCITMKKIHEDYIFPKWKISYKTFSNYMGINAKRELKKYEKQEKQQLKIDFDGK